MDQDVRRDPDDRFEQISRDLLRWVLGPGLLSVHVGVYLFTLVTLILWNLARSPNDVWVDDPLRRWGLVVVFHATAVAAGWAAWRLMQMGQTASTPETRSRPPRSRLAPVTPSAPVGTPAPAPRTVSLAATTEEWARRWLRDSVRIVREAVGPDAVANGHAENGYRARPTASAVAGPEITEWGTLFARRAREMMVAARDHIAHAPQSANGSAAAIPHDAPADPTSTWPGGTDPGPRPMTDEVRSPASGGTWPAPPHDEVSGEQTPEAADNRSVTPFPAESSPVGDADSDGEAVDAAVTDTASEDARWTWVEAAAAAWLARRERDDDPPADPVETPPPPGDQPTANP
jgi:hypothetical protein